MPGNKEYPESILVIEDDVTLHSIMVEGARVNPGQKIICRDEGQDGWSIANSEVFDFLILDWKLPHLSGLCLFNRFRNHEKYQHCPILVISGFLTNKDFSVLDDYPLTSKMEKPFQGLVLRRMIRDLWKEAKWYGNEYDKLTKVLENIDEKNVESVSNLKAIIEKSPKPIPICLAAARILRSQDQMKLAKKMLNNALKMQPQSSMLLTEIGKLHLQQGDFSKAKRLLLKAQKLSPNNLDRLCELGKLNLHELETDDASHFFDEALAIDIDSQQALQGKKLASNIDQYFRYGSSLKIPDSFASMLNAIGISMAQSGDFQESEEHYESAMQYVNDNTATAKLSFNLALCYIRWQKPNLAVPWLQKAIKLAPGFEKAQIHLQRIKKKLGISTTSTKKQSITAKANVSDTYDLSWLENTSTSIDDSLLFQQMEENQNTTHGKKSIIPLPLDEMREEDGFSMERLIEASPDIEEYFQLMIRMGIHVDSHVPRLNELLTTHGQLSFAEAIREAINLEKYTTEELSHILQTKAKAS